MILARGTQCSEGVLCSANQLFGENVFRRSNWEDLLLGTGFCLPGLQGWGMRSRPVQFLSEDGKEDVPEYEERF